MWYTYILMPLLARAIKKLRHDRKRTVANRKAADALARIVKSFRKSPTKKALIAVFKALDKAAKTKRIHANRAARLKSRLSKLLKK